MEHTAGEAGRVRWSIPLESIETVPPEPCPTCESLRQERRIDMDCDLRAIRLLIGPCMEREELLREVVTRWKRMPKDLRERIEEALK